MSNLKKLKRNAAVEEAANSKFLPKRLYPNVVDFDYVKTNSKYTAPFNFDFDSYPRGDKRIKVVKIKISCGCLNYKVLDDKINVTMKTPSEKAFQVKGDQKLSRSITVHFADNTTETYYINGKIK